MFILMQYFFELQTVAIKTSSKEKFITNCQSCYGEE